MRKEVDNNRNVDVKIYRKRKNKLKNSTMMKVKLLFSGL